MPDLAGSAADAGPSKADAGLNYPIWHARGPSIHARGCDSVVGAVTAVGCGFASGVTTAQSEPERLPSELRLDITEEA